MRKLLLVLVTLLSLKASGQVWCTPGSVWRYKHQSISQYGFKQLDYLYDTLVAGKTCHLMREFISAINGMGILYQYHRYFYTYSANKTVYLLTSTNPVRFDTLYDFNATIGDKWRVPPTSVCTNSYVTVTDTGHMVIQGQSLRWLRLLSTFPPVVNYNMFSGIIVERIGAIHCFPYYSQNTCPNNIDAGNGGVLYCFSDQDISEYRTNTYQDACDHIYVSINELKNSEQSIRLYPNPSRNSFTFEFGDLTPNEKTVLLITDLSGREIKQQVLNFRETMHQVDLSGLDQGLYTTRLIANGKVVYTGKIVKE